jgi:hypothetical protein
MLTAWGCLYEELTAPQPKPAAARLPRRVAA